MEDYSRQASAASAKISTAKTMTVTGLLSEIDKLCDHLDKSREHLVVLADRVEGPRPNEVSTINDPGYERRSLMGELQGQVTRLNALCGAIDAIINRIDGALGSAGN